MSEKEFLFDREALLREIHARPPFSCGPFVRTTRATFLYGSLNDRMRKEIVKKWIFEPNKDEGSELRRLRLRLGRKHPSRQLIAALAADPFRNLKLTNRRLGLSDDCNSRELFEEQWYASRRKQGLSVSREDKQRDYSLWSRARQQDAKFDKALQTISECLFLARTERTGAIRKKASRWIRKTIRLLDRIYNPEDAPLKDTPNSQVNFHWKVPFSERYRALPDAEYETKRYDRHFLSTEAQGASRLDLFWRPNPETDYRFRTRWENFDHSQNFSCIEDIAREDAPSPDDAIIGFRQAPGPLNYDAFSSFLGAVDDAKTASDESQERGPPSKTFPIMRDKREGFRENEIEGGILCAARYWLAPFSRTFETICDRPGSKVPERFNPGIEALSSDEEKSAAINSAGEQALSQLREYAEALSNGGFPDPGDHEDVRNLLDEIARCYRHWLRVEGDPFTRRQPGDLRSDGNNDTADDDQVDREHRDDFVFSFIVGGRALLVSDLRPDQRSEDEWGNWEDASRTLIIDLGLTAEQRGRVLSRLMDVSTFRVLALRGQPHVNAAIDVMGDLSKALSTIEIDAPIPSRQRPNEFGISDLTAPSDTQDQSFVQHPSMRLLSEDARKRIATLGKSKKHKNQHRMLEQAWALVRQDLLETRLEGLNQVSRILDTLNLFFTYGVSGKRQSTQVYSAQISDNLEALRETRIQGWQTLDEYMRRYFASAAQIDRLGERYDNTRNRLNGALDLLRSEFNLDQLRNLNSAADDHTAIMEKAVKASRLSAFAAILATMIAGASAWSSYQQFKEDKEYTSDVTDGLDDLTAATNSMVSNLREEIKLQSLILQKLEEMSEVPDASDENAEPDE